MPRQTKKSDSIDTAILVVTLGIIGAIVSAFFWTKKVADANSTFDPSGKRMPSETDPSEISYTLYFPFETNAVEECYLHKIKLERVDVPIIAGGNGLFDPLKRAPFGRLAFNGGDIISPGEHYININRCNECVQITERVRQYTRETIEQLRVQQRLRQRY